MSRSCNPETETQLKSGSGFDCCHSFEASCRSENRAAVLLEHFEPRSPRHQSGGEPMGSCGPAGGEVIRSCASHRSRRGRSVGVNAVADHARLGPGSGRTFSKCASFGRAETLPCPSPERVARDLFIGSHSRQARTGSPSYGAVMTSKGAVLSKHASWPLWPAWSEMSSDARPTDVRPSETSSIAAGKWHTERCGGTSTTRVRSFSSCRRRARQSVPSLFGGCGLSHDDVVSSWPAEESVLCPKDIAMHTITGG